MVRHATPEELKEVYGHFHKRRDFFPHIRQDYVTRMIAAGQCVYEEGVIITYQKYKKSTRIGTVLIPAGAIMLHQILNSGQFNGAAGRVFKKFVDEIVKSSGGDLYLSVRADNPVARGFYAKHGMKEVGTVIWDGGKMPGVVYMLEVQEPEKTIEDFFA